MEPPESQNSRDARIEKLWKKLDPQSKGELDLNGLKKGLTRIDHREFARNLPQELPSLTATIALKNANDMLKDVIKAMDKNGDEMIQYEGMSSNSWRGLTSFLSDYMSLTPDTQNFALSLKGRRRSFSHCSILSTEIKMAS